MHTVESEAHFLVECPLYDDQRESILHEANECNAEFLNMSISDKCAFLLGSQNHVLRYNVIKCVDKMFNHRKLFTSK
jgi:hypothetical protein